MGNYQIVLLGIGELFAETHGDVFWEYLMDY